MKAKEGKMKEEGLRWIAVSQSCSFPCGASFVSFCLSVIRVHRISKMRFILHPSSFILS
jgi:hypothetical protein